MDDKSFLGDKTRGSLKNKANGEGEKLKYRHGYLIGYLLGYSGICGKLTNEQAILRSGSFNAEGF